ncbi:Uroporphyrinogen-III synthase OS=Castellaniella defragrans OX=75697 GN=HNR28_002316 PE=3 SV=1 [Castellaniella defragrans]
MAGQLRARGWSVHCHALYERSPVTLDVSLCEKLAHTPDCVLLVTSLEALEAIDASLRRGGFAWPAPLRVVTLHPRMARRLQCWYADRPAGALHVSLSAPDDTALFHAILSASRLPH